MHIVLFIFLFIAYFITGGDKSMRSQAVRKQQVILMGFVLFIFAALRAHTVGTDIWGYFGDYIKDASSSPADILTDRQGREPFFHLVLYALSWISDDPQIMLVFVGAVVAIGFSYFTYNQKGNVLLFFVLFIGFRMYAFTLSGLRQACAMSFVYIAYTQLRNHKILPYLLLTALASLFHNSAVVSLLMFPIFKFKKDYLVISMAFLVVAVNIASGGALASLLATTIFKERFENYIARSATYSDWGLTFFIYFVVYLLILVKYKLMGRQNVGFHEDFRLLTVAIMFAFIGQTTDSVFRINYYFIFIIIPLLAQLLKALSANNQQTEKTLTSIVVIAMTAQYLLLGASGIDDYQFFWDVPYLG